MSLYPMDDFSNDQAPSTIIPYTPGFSTWSPTSSYRTTSSYATISGGLLTVAQGSPIFGRTLTYSFSISGPINYVPLKNITFQGVTNSEFSSAFYIFIIDVNGSVASVGVTVPANYSGDFTAPSTNLTTQTIGFAIGIAVNASASAPITIQGISPNFVCLARNSLILTKLGYKPIQDIERGEEIEGGKVAQVIKQEIPKNSLLSVVIFPKDCLEKDVPFKETISCAEHYFIYKGKRRIAKCFLAFPVVYKKDKVENILEKEGDGNFYLYDIQYDHEGEYVVNNMVSQSRSPYAKVSPLPKELYFNPENYKEERVDNTLTSEPEISFNYLLPDGQEVESLFIVRKHM